MTGATASWHVEVDKTLCMGTEACVHAIPAVFAIGDDGAAHVVGPVEAGGALLRDVVAECPTGALSLVRADEKGQAS